ncbi:MAG: hypothetical protein ACR2IF_03300 [Terriglobales bacterium]
MRRQSAFIFIGIVAVIVTAGLTAPPQAHAIPAFARKYQTSCTTCHDSFPHLNDFGKAFKDAGFKFPSEDETFIKIPPVLLGAPAQKELWPKTVWPGTIPGMPPIGLRMNNFFQVVGRNRGNFESVQPPPPGVAGPPFVPGFVPRSDFETGLFSIFTAGNFGSDIAFWVDDDLSVAGAGGAGGLGDGYLKFVNIGRFLHLPKDALHLRAGQFELELPFSPARSWNLSPWDIYDQAAIGSINPNANVLQHNVNNGFALSNAAQGVELSGGHHYGGYYWALAIVNQTTGTQTIDTSGLVPSATGANSGGLGFLSDANFKDIYGRLAYRFNLERDSASRRAIQAAGAMGPRTHTYLTVGTLYYYGRSVQRVVGADSTGAPASLTAREPFYRVGGDFDFNYRNFNLFGQFVYGRDHNLLPVCNPTVDSLCTGTPLTAAGTTALIPLPVETGVSPIPVGFVHSIPATFSGGFLQADYMPLPWIMLIMRYDGVNTWADFINGQESITAGNFFGPVRHTRNRFTPGVQFLIHANIKASFEYQIRPQQQVLNGINPITGATVVTNPFRTNTVTAGLEFVY